MQHKSKLGRLEPGIMVIACATLAPSTERLPNVAICGRCSFFNGTAVACCSTLRTSNYGPHQTLLTATTRPGGKMKLLERFLSSISSPWTKKLISIYFHYVLSVARKCFQMVWPQKTVAMTLTKHVQQYAPWKLQSSHLLSSSIFQKVLSHLRKETPKELLTKHQKQLVAVSKILTHLSLHSSL